MHNKLIIYYKMGLLMFRKLETKVKFVIVSVCMAYGFYHIFDAKNYVFHIKMQIENYLFYFTIFCHYL